VLLAVAGAAVAAVAGCGVRPVDVPGAAVPVTASVPRSTASGGTGAAGTTTPAATGSGGGTNTDSPPPTGSLPAVPDDYETLTMSGFGLTVALPVPAAWARKPSTSPGRTRTDVDLENPEVLLRIDLSARGAGSAEDGAVRIEAALTLPGYRRLAITPVPGIGDDAVDWTFTFVRDGQRQVVDRQVQAGTGTVAVYYSAPGPLYERYLPVWRRAVDELTITAR
jgi:hypothetical protein